MIDDNLDTDDSVVLVLRPEEMKHESHDLIRERSEELVVRKSLDDLKQGVTKFLWRRGGMRRRHGSAWGLERCGGDGDEGSRGSRREREEEGGEVAHLLSRVPDEDWRSFTKNLGESW